VWIRLGDDAKAIWHRLSRIGILTNLIRLPREDSFGLRLGLAGLTRRGYTPEEVAITGQLLAAAVAGKPREKTLQQRVAEIAMRPREMRFTFPAPVGLR